MKLKFSVTLAALLLLGGCTTPSNKIADEALARGLRHTDGVVTDLANQSRYYIAQYHLERIKAAKGDEALVTQEVNKLVNTIIRVDWLAMDVYNKAREYTRSGQRYIWEQRGILDLLLEDFKTAKQRALGDDKAPDKTTSVTVEG